MVETRGKTVLRIANNEYVPKEESKAGMIHNPFSSNQQEEEQYQPTAEKEIFNRLFLDKEANEKLNPKSKVINPSKRAESEALSRVYKKMVSRGIAELRGNKGYYSLMGYSDAWLAFKSEV